MLFFAERPPHDGILHVSGLSDGKALNLEMGDKAIRVFLEGNPHEYYQIQVRIQDRETSFFWVKKEAEIENIEAMPVAKKVEILTRHFFPSKLIDESEIASVVSQLDLDSFSRLKAFNELKSKFIGTDGHHQLITICKLLSQLESSIERPTDRMREKLLNKISINLGLNFQPLIDFSNLPKKTYLPWISHDLVYSSLQFEELLAVLDHYRENPELFLSRRAFLGPITEGNAFYMGLIYHPMELDRFSRLNFPDGVDSRLAKLPLEVIEHLLSSRGSISIDQISDYVLDGDLAFHEKLRFAFENLRLSLALIHTLLTLKPEQFEIVMENLAYLSRMPNPSLIIQKIASIDDLAKLHLIKTNFALISQLDASDLVDFLEKSKNKTIEELGAILDYVIVLVSNSEYDRDQILHFLKTALKVTGCDVLKVLKLSQSLIGKPLEMFLSEQDYEKLSKIESLEFAELTERLQRACEGCYAHEIKAFLELFFSVPSELQTVMLEDPLFSMFIVRNDKGSILLDLAKSPPIVARRLYFYSEIFLDNLSLLEQVLPILPKWADDEGKLGDFITILNNLNRSSKSIFLKIGLEIPDRLWIQLKNFLNRKADIFHMDETQSLALFLQEKEVAGVLRTHIESLRAEGSAIPLALDRMLAMRPELLQFFSERFFDIESMAAAISKFDWEAIDTFNRIFPLLEKPYLNELFSINHKMEMIQHLIKNLKEKEDRVEINAKIVFFNLNLALEGSMQDAISGMLKGKESLLEHLDTILRHPEKLAEEGFIPRLADVAAYFEKPHFKRMYAFQSTLSILFQKDLDSALQKRILENLPLFAEKIRTSQEFIKVLSILIKLDLEKVEFVINHFEEFTSLGIGLDAFVLEVEKTTFKGPVLLAYLRYLTVLEPRKQEVFKLFSKVIPDRDLDFLFRVCLDSTTPSFDEIFLIFTTDPAVKDRMTAYFGEILETTDLELAKQIARVILHATSLLGLSDDEPLRQRAYAAYLATQDDRSPLNPYRIFSILSQNEELLAQSFPVIITPEEQIDDFKVKIIPEAFQLLDNPVYTKDQIPLGVTKEKLQELFSNLELRRLALTEDERAELDSKVQESFGISFSYAKKNLTESLDIKRWLDEPTAHPDSISITSLRLYQILSFLTSDQLSDRVDPETKLTEREYALLSASASIQACQIGKSEGIAIYCRTVLPQAFRSDAIAETTSSEETLKLLIKKAAADYLFSQLSEDTLMLRGLIGLTTPVSQVSHQALFIKNMIGKLIGLDHKLTFDPYTHVLYRQLATVNPTTLLSNLYQLFLPKTLVKLVQEKINSMDVYDKVNTLLRENGVKEPEGYWELVDYYRQGEIAKRGDEILSLEEAALNPSTVTWHLVTDEQMAELEDKIRWKEVTDTSDPRGIDFTSCRSVTSIKPEGVMMLCLALRFLESA
jgi:hypothetical protein